MNRELLLGELEEHEGFRPLPYKDSRGFWTVGIGRLIDKRRGGGLRPLEAEQLFGWDGKTSDGRVMAYQDAPVRWRGRPLTHEEALWLKGNDVDDVLLDLDRSLPWWREMTEPRQRVLANMCFNLGLSRLLRFKDALAHMQAGRYAAAAVEMLDSAWARQVGGRAVKLASMMKAG